MSTGTAERSGRHCVSGAAAPRLPHASGADPYQEACKLQENRRLEEARSRYRLILQAQPAHAGALHQLGLIEAQTGDPQAAIELIRRSLELSPDQPQAHLALGDALHTLRKPADALESYERALTLDPACAAALAGRGGALLELGRPRDALQSHERCLALRPDHARALFQHGNALMALGRPEDALSRYERVLQLQPDFEPALRAHARALLRLRRFKDALLSLARYQELYPQRAQPHAARGVALFELQRPEEALQSYDRALALDPSLAVALFHRAVALTVQGAYAEAIDTYARLLQIEPDYPWALGGCAHLQLMRCDWSAWPPVPQLQEAVAQGKPVIIPFALCAFSDSAALQRQCAVTYVSRLFPAAGEPLWARESYGHERVRVAYLSADFRSHPVSYLLTGLLERHDRQRFEITALSLRAAEDSPFGARVQAAADRFVNVQLHSDAEVAALIRTLQIDVLVDLQGHTLGTRAGILARRAAPVQVNFLGFPATMGADYIDYIIADAVVIPADAESAYAEQVVRLPHCYLPFDNQQGISEFAPTRPALGLPEDGFVFCAFHNTYKITPPVFDVWMRLLRGIPGSVLWLREEEPEAMSNLQREAAARGVDPARLVFAALLPSLEDHLARLRLADLFLDTLPYNAHATAAHALWAGVPVLTCRGNAFAARVGASLLTAAGLPELIAEDLARYESSALQLACSPERLAGMRALLQRERASCALFDTDRFRRALESAYTSMWQRAEAGQAPQAFEVAP
jgi:predicted O-linked N-acetylglucosamine transferase (SPINDLY family)